MAKLLNDGQTDLLPGFVAQRTRRPFKAFLVRGKDGKTGFEFEERKTPAKGKAAGNDEAEGAARPQHALPAAPRPLRPPPRRRLWAAPPKPVVRKRR